MIFPLAVIIILVSHNSGFAKDQSKSAKKVEIPLILQEVEEKYNQAKTLVASFVQVKNAFSQKQNETSTGILSFKRPDKFRWETRKPDPSILVSDGKIFRFYTPPFEDGDRGQLLIRSHNDVQSRLANALLSGSFSSAVVELSSIQKKTENSYILTPKAGTAGTVIKAEIETNPMSRLIERVILRHEGGNVADISLSKIELGTPLGDEVFHFEAPPGTDLLKE